MKRTASPGSLVITPWASITAGVVLLICVLHGFEFEIADQTLTLERLFAIPLLMVVLLICLAARTMTISRTSTLLLVCWLAVALIASLKSPVAAWSTKMWLVLALASTYYFIIKISKPDLGKVINGRAFFVIAILLGPVSVLVFALWFLNANLGVLADAWIQFGAGARLRATTAEANLLGALLPFFMLGMLARTDKHEFTWWVVFLGLHASMVLTFSRVPWFAYIVALGAYSLVKHPRRFNVRVAIGLMPIALILVLCTGLAAWALWSVLGEAEVLARTNSIRARFIMWELALDDIVARPFLGSGVFSLSELHPAAPTYVGAETFRSTWVSNIFLGVLHDTGLVGMVPFLAFVAVTLQRGWRTARRHATSGNRAASITAAVAVSTIVSLLISGQSIPSHSLAFFWVFFAFVDLETCMTKKEK